MSVENQTKQISHEIKNESSSALVDLVTSSSAKAFDDVIADFEAQLGRFDQSQTLDAQDDADLSRRLGEMQGESGLMVVAVLEMDQILPRLRASSERAKQYLVGNPLIADKMASVNTLAALFVPPRVLIYSHDERTFISYQKPSTTFGRLKSDVIMVTALDLDAKFAAIVQKALS